MASLQILWSLEAAYFLQLKEKQWDCHVVVVKFCFSTLMMYCIISGIFCFFICRIFKKLCILRFLFFQVCVPQLRAEVPQQLRHMPVGPLPPHEIYPPIDKTTVKATSFN